MGVLFGEVVSGGCRWFVEVGLKGREEREWLGGKRKEGEEEGKGAGG